MKYKDSTYHCSFLPPLLLAIFLLSLGQIAKANAETTLVSVEQKTTANK